jgi:hypothetical protein
MVDTFQMKPIKIQMSCRRIPDVLKRDMYHLVPYECLPKEMWNMVIEYMWTQLERASPESYNAYCMVRDTDGTLRVANGQMESFGYLLYDVTQSYWCLKCVAHYRVQIFIRASTYILWMRINNAYVIEFVEHADDIYSIYLVWQTKYNDIRAEECNYSLSTFDMPFFTD